jgi:hypothetical protein
MPSPPTPERHTGRHFRRWSVLLVLGSSALVGAVFTGLRVGGDLNAVIHPAPVIGSSSSSNAEASIVLTGMGSRRGAPFHLAGGTYRVVWSAWGPAAAFPPCTHSAELMAVDPANASTSSGHVADLAKLAHVPATGASDERYIANLKPGDYYVDVNSECGWQIGISLSG